jgi:hypothetical protein
MNKDRRESHISYVYMLLIVMCMSYVRRASMKLFRLKEYLIEMEKTLNDGNTNTR